MLRRCSILAVAVAVTGLAAVALSAPAHSGGGPTTNITAPLNGTHYLVTSDTWTTTVPVTGTSNLTTGAFVDVRCYTNLFAWNTVTANVPVAANGSFATTMNTSVPYGTCLLRAVPAGWAGGSNLRSFTGPRITGEAKYGYTIDSGPNAGKVYNYYVLIQSAHALNDYVSATEGGIWDSRLQYSDGTSSLYLWYGNAGLPHSETDTRSYLKVDGHNAYGPYAAEEMFADHAGLPELTFSVTRNVHTGDYTIHETDPIVVCPNETPFPPTAVSCPNFKRAGVRLERTIVATDGGRRIHITDIWRSTDHKAHTISAHYDNWVQGKDYAPPGSDTPVGFQFPWISNAYKTFSTDHVYPGPASAPRTVFIRDDNTAPDGSLQYPRGAVSFDYAPHHVRRIENREFVLQDEGIKVPAGGTHRIRQYYVLGTSESQVAAKAAADRKLLG
jgi:hypothetical protein